MVLWPALEYTQYHSVASYSLFMWYVMYRHLLWKVWTREQYQPSTHPHESEQPWRTRFPTPDLFRGLIVSQHISTYMTPVISNSARPNPDSSSPKTGFYMKSNLIHKWDYPWCLSETWTLSPMPLLPCNLLTNPPTSGAHKCQLYRSWLYGSRRL